MFMDKKRKSLVCVLSCLSLFCFGFGIAQAELSPIEQLGEHLYFDTNLSGVHLAVPPEILNPDGQSCSSCHDPDFGFVDPDSDLPVSEGVIFGRFGGRNSPSAAYAMFAPTLYFDEAEGLWIGGQFWDGRATGNLLGDPLADQALGPFVNPVEMANASKNEVIDDIRSSEYASLFEQVWGKNSLNNVKKAYDQVALSIAAFERTAGFAKFDSKYDFYLKACIQAGGEMNECAQGIGDFAEDAGQIFSNKEWKGLKLFMGENNNDGVMEAGEGAMCSACHIAEWIPDPGNVVVPDWAPTGYAPPVFTDFTFDNLGVPQNFEFPLTGVLGPDLGLGVTVGDPDENGKFKVMSLRNIGLTAPYAHNGLFKDLEEITHFYNTRDVPSEGWAAPEYPVTVNRDELGNLGLKNADENALVEFMMTLNDGYMP